MDKTVMIVGAIAIIVILAFTLVLNPFSGSPTKNKETETAPDYSAEPQEPPEEDDEPKNRTHEDDIDYEDATFGVMLEEVEGDCTLYKHVADDKFECFGTAGEYHTLATNEYRPSDSEEYFCKSSPYGCKLYQKVTFNF